MLRLVDTSVYNQMIKLTCPQLLVTYPGFSTSHLIVGVQPNYILNLTACDLGVQKSNCGASFVTLQDGIYVIRWSVSPNDVVYVEYNHLRITGALKRIDGILCDLDLRGCEPTPDNNEKLNKLCKLSMQLKAAKAMVETCHKPKQGMDIYNHVVKQLDKFACRTCK